MNKLLICKLILVAIIIFSIFYLISFYIINNTCDEKIEPFDSEKLFNVKSPMLVGGNGTRFYLKDIKPIYLENKEPIFYLTMQLIIPEFNNSISIVDINSDIKLVYEPLFPDNKNGSYYIENLPVYLPIQKGNYPYDYFLGNITIVDEKASYDNIFTYWLFETYSSSNWEMDIFGNYNKLYFRAYRVKDIQVFENIENLGISLIITNFLAFGIILFVFIFIKLDKKQEMKNYLRIINLFGYIPFFIGILIGIPFYFSVILNSYVFTTPQIDSICITNITNLMWCSLLIASITYALKNFIEKNK
ncbi:MAG: hypothetical protein ACFFDN_43705 [Candidatus Hodarchaeota archaeon]